MKKEGFSVSLFNPDTNAPYTEFQREGETYVEVYPDAQYFIKITPNFSLDHHHTFLAHTYVDGKDLGRHWYITRSFEPVTVGIWNREEQVNQSLSFVRPKIETNSAVSNNVPGMPSIFGEVTVCIHEAVVSSDLYMDDAPCPTEERIMAESTSSDQMFVENFSMDNAMLTVPERGAGESIGKKTMRSAPGEIKLPSKKAKQVKSSLSSSQRKPAAPPQPQLYGYRGVHVASFTFKYCSTVGLIVAGVLPKPTPNWTPPTGCTRATTEPLMTEAERASIKETIITYKDENNLEHQAVEIDMTALDNSDNGDIKEAVITYKDSSNLKHQAVKVDMTNHS